jgi:hypothetical protein
MEMWVEDENGVPTSPPIDLMQDETETAPVQDG